MRHPNAVHQIEARPGQVSGDLVARIGESRLDGASPYRRVGEALPSLPDSPADQQVGPTGQESGRLGEPTLPEGGTGWKPVLRVRQGALLCFFLAAIPPLLLIPAYSWATIGNPFALPYSFNESFPEMKQGVYAIHWPDAQTAFNLLFSPSHGLFFWSPFLLMAGLGYPALLCRSAGAFWLMYAVPLLQVVVISGRVWDWQAGFCFGPRYLAPMLPLLALPCALGAQRWPKLGILLGIYSIAVVTLATLTDACADYTVYNPLTELNIPKFLKGEFSYNLGTTVFGLPPFVSVALFYALLIGGIAWLWRLTGEPNSVESRGLRDGN